MKRSIGMPLILAIEPDRRQVEHQDDGQESVGEHAHRAGGEEKREVGTHGGMMPHRFLRTVE